MNKGQQILGRALNLTLAIYRLTDKFPKGEVLIRQLRKLGNEIVADLASDDFKEKKTEKKINVSLLYFKIAKAQNWVKDINWLILEKEYSKLKEEIVGLRLSRLTRRAEEIEIESYNIKERREQAEREPSRVSELSLRQQKILAEIKQKETLKMSDLIPLFKNQASERTLRNDLQFLLRQNLIAKRGAKKTTVYFLR